jgi:hypothetical protein
MIESLITYLNTNFAELKYYKNIFGLCEIIKKEDSEFPAYREKTTYKNVSDFDKQVGTIYYRLNGTVTNEVIEDEDILQLERRTFPLRLVSVVKRKELACCFSQSSYQDIELAEQLARIINTSYSQFAKDNKYEFVDVELVNYSTDRNTIINSEFKIKSIKFDYDYSIIALDLQATIGQYKKCQNVKQC